MEGACAAPVWGGTAGCWPGAASAVGYTHISPQRGGREVHAQHATVINSPPHEDGTFSFHYTLLLPSLPPKTRNTWGSGVVLVGVVSFPYDMQARWKQELWLFECPCILCYKQFQYKDSCPVQCRIKSKVIPLIQPADWSTLNLKAVASERVWKLKAVQEVAQCWLWEDYSSTCAQPKSAPCTCKK